jgi:hypothetical protein
MKARWDNQVIIQMFDATYECSTYGRLQIKDYTVRLQIIDYSRLHMLNICQHMLNVYLGWAPLRHDVYGTINKRPGRVVYIHWPNI